jgi:uncharacterized lipoprotein YajG
MTTPSSTAGERKLPGGRAALLVSIALLASCASPATTVGILTVRCTLGDQVQTAKAQVLLP